MSSIQRDTVTVLSSWVTTKSDSLSSSWPMRGRVDELLVGEVHQVVQNELVVARRARWSRHRRPIQVESIWCMSGIRSGSARVGSPSHTHT